MIESLTNTDTAFILGLAGGVIIGAGLMAMFAAYLIASATDWARAEIEATESDTQDSDMPEWARAGAIREAKATGEVTRSLGSEWVAVPVHDDVHVYRLEESIPMNETNTEADDP